MKPTNKMLLGSLFLYVISLALPAFLLEGQSVYAWPGIGPFLFGWMDLLEGHVAWFANPFAVLAAVFLLTGQIRWARVASSIAVVLACDTVRFHAMPGPPQTPLTLGPAWYVWAASLLLLLVASFVAKPATKHESKAEAPAEGS